MERHGLLHGWVQQNHDGLPQKAGFPQVHCSVWIPVLIFFFRTRLTKFTARGLIQAIKLFSLAGNYAVICSNG